VGGVVAVGSAVGVAVDVGLDITVGRWVDALAIAVAVGEAMRPQPPRVPVRTMAPPRSRR